MNSGRRMGLRLALGAAFLLMGFSFSITQTLLAREMLVSFAGNELSIGLILGSWLLLEAVGSGPLVRLVSPPRPDQRRRPGNSARRFARLQILFATTLLPLLGLATGARHLVGGVPGQGMGLLAISLTSFLLLVPVGLVDGAMFTVGCSAEQDSGRGTRSAARVYALEGLGGLAGGLLFTYLLVPALKQVQIALVLASVNLSSALSLLVVLRSAAPEKGDRASLRWVAGLVLLLLVFLGLLLSPAADLLHSRLLAWRWQGQEVAFADHSHHGSVDAIRHGEQVTFFANGTPIITAPVPDTARIEEIVHLPMLFVEQPRRALVLGGGLGGVLSELLKYPLERLDYAEMDPLLVEAVRSVPSDLTDAELADERLHVRTIDGRLLVQTLAADPEALGPRYDLILVNLPYPATLQLNRFYTAEFWGLAGTLLTEKGVLAFPAPGSLSYLSPALRSLHTVLSSTLREQFPHVRPIPGETTLWLASRSEEVETDQVEALVRRWQSRQLPSLLISDFHIQLALDGEALRQFRGALGDPSRVTVNRDLHPTGILHGLAYWSELFSPGATRFFMMIRGLRLPPLLVAIGALAVAGAWLLRWRRAGDDAAIPIAIGVTGFAGMSADLVMIFTFQVFYGHVYHFIGLLVAAFMGGLTLGAWLMARRRPRSGAGTDRRSDRSWLLGLELALLGFWLLLPVGLLLLHERLSQGALQAGVAPVLVLLNAITGLLVGGQFPLGSRLLASREPDAGRRAGILYAVDLLGGFAASVLVSVVLLPVLGVVQTCLLVAGMKAGSLLLVAATSGRSRSEG